MKPSTLVRHHSNHLHEVLVSNTELISHHQPEEFMKSQKEASHVCTPLRILLSGIHLGWTRRAPPGRTLSQNDWLKTTQKLISSALNPGLCEPRGRAILLVSLILLLSTQVPFPNKISCFITHVSPRTIHFWVLDRSPVSFPGSSPPSCNKPTLAE